MPWVTDGSVPLHGSTLNWNTRKDVITQWWMPLCWVTTQLDPDMVKSLLNSHIGNSASGWSSWSYHSWGQPLFGTRGTCHNRLCICTNACYWLGWSPERGPDVEHSVGLAEGTEEDRFEGTSGRTHLQWRRQADLMESAEFYNLLRSLEPALNAQRWG